MQEGKQPQNNSHQTEQVPATKAQHTAAQNEQKAKNDNKQLCQEGTTQNQKVSSQNHQSCISEDEEIPDHFYDSDLASVNEKDFLSDNEPPKDQVQERKLLFKEKLLHVFKTIIRLGNNIDKPARFDRIKLKFKEVPKDEVVPHPLKKKVKKSKKEQEKKGQGSKQEQEEGEKEEVVEDKDPMDPLPAYYNSFYLMDTEQIEYNLGKEYEDIERFVTSMKRGEAAVFELQHLEVSKKSNIKNRVKVEVFVIWVEDWTTVIDVDCDGRFMKEVLRRGEGHHRIAKHDEVSFEWSLKRGNEVVKYERHDEPIKLEAQYLSSVPVVLWKLLHSLKAKECVKVLISDEVLKEVEGSRYQQLLQKQEHSQSEWQLQIEIFWFHSIDDVFLDGRLFKKTLVKGVSTARPQSSSTVYYALKFIGKKVGSQQEEVLYTDPCFDSDWWQDFSKLDAIGCRKDYLDDEKISYMLKKTMKRMKPAEVAEIECRDKSMFTFGQDYQEYKKLTGCQELPDVVKLGVRVYNFTEGRNCFNMELENKISEARRQKPIAVKFLERGQVERALKTFEKIVSYFGTGKINQAAYDQKISALMNSSLCHLKLKNYSEMVTLCDQILETPRHGYDPDKLKIKGPGYAKIEGKLPDEPGYDERQQAELEQNDKILDKCRYRKAFGLVKMGEGAKALQLLSQIKSRTEEVTELEKEAEKAKKQYEKKAVKMFKNMFG